MLYGLVADIRRGESRSLVLRGEAGVGKTALLEYLIASAPELSVARAVGVESEMELAYSSLHQLCWTMLDQLERLPDPQRLRLEVTFGLTAGAAPDPFLVALATLSLLSEATEERPAAVRRGRRVLGVEARTRALVAAPADAEAFLSPRDRAPRAHTVPRRTGARALVYGEWLRRENRRVDAHAQLRAAHDLLTSIGM